MQKQLEELLADNVALLCKELPFDVAILMQIQKDKKSLKVLKLFGDFFARPDLTEGKIIKDSGSIYKNEFALIQDESQFSNLPIMGLGADYGVRFHNSPYIVVFDDIFGAPEIDHENKTSILNFKLKVETELDAKA